MKKEETGSAATRGPATPERWVRVPGPGQFRGEGEWQVWQDSCLCDDDWSYCQHMFPTHEGEKPE
jgi:hypothetical protein